MQTIESLIFDLKKLQKPLQDSDRILGSLLSISSNIIKTFQDYWEVRSKITQDKWQSYCEVMLSNFWYYYYYDIPNPEDLRWGDAPIWYKKIKPVIEIGFLDLDSQEILSAIISFDEELKEQYIYDDIPSHPYCQEYENEDEN